MGRITDRKHDAMRLAAEVRVSQRTVERWMDGEDISPGLAYGLRLAAKELGIELADDDPEET